MNVIFVFGSNLAGHHGGGAAREALEKWGAVYGQGEGLQGSSFAIPTKDENLRTLSLTEIELGVSRFIRFARSRPDLSFPVTAIGCGLAGLDPKDILPMFGKELPENVFLSGKLTNAA
jgi:hypothetical protein